MKSLQILLLFMASSEVCNSVADAIRTSIRDKSRKVDQFWVPKPSPGGSHSEGRPRRAEYYAYRRSPDGDSDDSEDPDMPMGMDMSMSMTTSSSMSSSDSPESGRDEKEEKPKKIQIPQINFYNSVPNGMGFIGQGLLWLREISAAMGTPLPLWIGSIPLFLIGIGLIFLPDLTTLGIPFFYPAGAEGDPFAAFPPIPEITIPDIGDIGSGSLLSRFLQGFLQLVSNLLPPTIASMKG